MVLDVGGVVVMCAYGGGWGGQGVVCGSPHQCTVSIVENCVNADWTLYDGIIQETPKRPTIPWSLCLLSHPRISDLEFDHTQGKGLSCHLSQSVLSCHLSQESGLSPIQTQGSDLVMITYLQFGLPSFHTQGQGSGLSPFHTQI